ESSEPNSLTVPAEDFQILIDDDSANGIKLGSQTCSKAGLNHRFRTWSSKVTKGSKTHSNKGPKPGSNKGTKSAVMIFHHTHHTEFIVNGTAVGQDPNSESQVQQYFNELLGLIDKNTMPQKTNPHLAVGPAIRAGLKKVQCHGQGCKEARCFFFGHLCSITFVFGKRK
ncbi:unnamed protein product, partial [Leptidea sinapis]